MGGTSEEKNSETFAWIVKMKELTAYGTSN